MLLKTFQRQQQLAQVALDQVRLKRRFSCSMRDERGAFLRPVKVECIEVKALTVHQAQIDFKHFERAIFLEPTDAIRTLA